MLTEPSFIRGFFFDRVEPAETVCVPRLVFIYMTVSRSSCAAAYTDKGTDNGRMICKTIPSVFKTAFVPALRMPDLDWAAPTFTHRLRPHAVARTPHPAACPCLLPGCPADARAGWCPE